MSDQATLTPCSNTSCSMRLACERGNRTPTADQDYVSFSPSSKDSCDWFVVRHKLIDEAAVFRKKAVGRQKHNRHAPFEDKAITNERLRLSAKRPEVRLQAPDLMVKRHIKLGRNIKGED